MFEKKNTFWLLKNNPLLSDVSHLKVLRLGIKAFKKVGRFIKPTTRIIQYFGHLATRAVFNCDEKQLKKLIDGEHIPIGAELENGYMILSLKGQVLGLGLLIDGTVRSQLPLNDVRFLTVLE